MCKVKYQMVPAILWTLTFKKNYHLRPSSSNEIQTLTSRSTEYSELSQKLQCLFESSVVIWTD